MNRRDTLQALVALAAGASASVRAAEGNVPRRLVSLSGTSAESVKTPAIGALRARMDERLKALGWEVGRNLRVDRYYSEGIAERLPSLLAEAMREPVDVIWVLQTSPAVAAARATHSIPIVLVGASVRISGERGRPFQANVDAVSGQRGRRFS